MEQNKQKQLNEQEPQAQSDQNSAMVGNEAMRPDKTAEAAELSKVEESPEAAKAEKAAGAASPAAFEAGETKNEWKRDVVPTLFGAESTVGEDERGKASDAVNGKADSACSIDETTGKAKKGQCRLCKLLSGLTQKTWFWIAAAFLLPIFVMGIIYILFGVYPFGKYSCLTLDLNGQYVYYFEKFREVFYSGDNLLYAWERALGGEFLGIFFYYLCSPFTLLVVLFPKGRIVFAILAILLCKMGTCGATFYYYLKKTRRGKPVQMLIFSLLYAVCAYGVTQSMNTMWIDAMYLLPLMLLGLERLVRHKKFKLYTIMLAAIFICNYYIGFMVAIFTAIYFLYAYFSANRICLGRRFWGTFGLFIACSLTAALIACIAFVPAYYALSFGKATFQNTSFAMKQNFDFLDFFAKLLPASYDTVRPEGLPVVYCGVLTLLFVPLYFFGARISGKRKILSGLMLAFLLVSMNFSTLDRVWHGFARPNWLNHRYSFMFCFLLIVMAWDAFRGMKKIPFRYVGATGVGICALVCLMQKLDYGEYLGDFSTIWVTIGCVILYLLLLYPIRRGRHYTTVALLICVAAELIVSGYCDDASMRADIGYGQYADYTTRVPRLRSAMEMISSHDDSLFRTERTMTRSVNEPMGAGLYGVSHSTSTLDASVIAFLDNMGYSSITHWSAYLRGNPVADSLLGIRYVIAKESDADQNNEEAANLAVLKSLYRYMDETSSGYSVYKNAYESGMVYGVNSAIASFDFEKYSNPCEALNALVGTMLGQETPVALFRLIEDHTTETFNAIRKYRSGFVGYKVDDETADGGVAFHLTAEDDNPIYVYMIGASLDVSARVNGNKWGKMLENDSGRIMCLGTYQAGDEISLELVANEEDQKFYYRDTDKYFYSLDLSLFREIMPALRRNTMEITDWSNTSLSGTIAVDRAHSTILTSIPTDDGWHIKIDGESVESTEALNALIAIDASGLSEGKHTISFTYFPRIYLIGILACAAGNVLFALLMLLFGRQKKKLSAGTIAGDEETGDGEDSHEK